MRIPQALVLLLARIDDHDLMTRVGPAAWAKGVSAWNNGRVLDLEYDSDSVLIGRVRDSGLTYRTRVKLTGGAWDMTCACTVGRDCFHCIATLLAARERTRDSQADSPAQWRCDLVRLIGESDGHGEPLALLIDAHDVAAPLWMTPLRRGVTVAWTAKRASWPDLVSTQWESVTDGLNPTHVALIREGYRLSRDTSTWQSRNEVSLDSLGREAWAWLTRLNHAGVTLIASLNPYTPLILDSSTWDLDLDARYDGGELTLAPIARNGSDLITLPRINAPTRLLIADGGTRIAALSGSSLIDAIPSKGLVIPGEDIAEFTASFLPRLRRQFIVVSSDQSVDFEEEPPARLIATVRPEARGGVVVRWWAEYDYSGTVSRIPLARALNTPGIAAIVARINALGVSRAPAGLWSPGPSDQRMPTWKAPRFLNEVVARVEDPDLVWDVSEDVASISVDPDGMRIGIRMSSAECDWFDLEARIELAGVEVAIADVLEALSRGEEYLEIDGRWVHLRGDAVRRLKELLDEVRLLTGGTTPRLAPVHAGLWEQIEDIADDIEAPRMWRDRIRALTDADMGGLGVSNACRAVLRPYQELGHRWLTERARAGLGGILADDMGLGKTLQILSAVAALKENPPGDPDSQTSGAPVLVVAPTSVLSTWKREADRFFPDLGIVVIPQTRRRRDHDVSQLALGADIVVTSYTILRNDAEEWAATPFSGLIIDEAQAAKNPNTATHRALRSVNTPWAFAVTGTPVENSLSDLWAILALTTPGLLPTWRVFNEAIRRPIENDGDEEALARLRRLVAPFMLRRSKEEVARDLPDKVESLVGIDLGEEHRRIYDQFLMRERAAILTLMDDYPNHRIDILASITRLRQLALDPALVEEAHAHVGSAKTEYLADQLAEIIPRGHRVLVFSQFTSFLARIREALERRGLKGIVQLDGSTTNRDGVIDSFTSGECPIFLISLKAGGVGLTLTEADYVYLMDPWWNPAAEAQAVDRAHRIGQTKKVNVYRLVANGTVEEKVVALQEKKRQLVTTVIEGGAGRALDLDDLRALLD